METQENRFTELWQLYIQNKATATQVKELFEYVRHNPLNEDRVALLQELTDKYPAIVKIDASVQENMLQEILASVKNNLTNDKQTTPVHRTHFLRKWGWAAAIFILAIGSGIYYLNNNHSKSYKSGESVVNDIAPGGNKAIWTLADGKRIELDSTVLDMTAKLPDGIGYNELSTPRGGQYQLILPDGSKVWLNAASSIKYPVAFTDKERVVQVTGEAYFEVAKNKDNPFIVKTQKEEIFVLGTNFNVNAYPEEGFAKITLLEGSVKVEDNILTPGQTYYNNSIITANTEQVIAWKNGNFNFQGLTMKEVMGQLERWYNIRVKYENTLPDLRFKGQMDRGVKLSTILLFLSDNGMHCRLEGKTLIVTDK